PPVVPDEYHRRRNALPPKTRSSKPITLVLDLDETLVHCTTVPIPGSTLRFPVVHEDKKFDVSGNIRPFAETFLKKCAELFEVVVFTASQQAYADRLLNILDPGKKCIKHRLFRDSCVFAEGNYLKDLRVLGRDLSKVIIVDNAPQAFSYQVDNGIPIQSWYDDEQDKHLLDILQFLEKIAGCDDVRPHLDERFRVRERMRKAQSLFPLA
ncbi:MAG: HAD-like domain-containing protein, partial [Piptocephalis tieghemiana]